MVFYMLPIAGFEYLDDSYLLLVSDVIQAINKVSPNSLTINLVNELERKKIIKTILHTEEIGRIISAQLQGYNIPEFSHRITKHEALKLLKIANGSQELKEIPKAAKSKLSFSEIEIPKTSRKGDVFNFAYECIKAYVNDKGEMPASAEALIEHCMKIGVDGYSEIRVIGKKERDRRITCLEIPKGITWVRFAEWITKFKEKQN